MNSKMKKKYCELQNVDTDRKNIRYHYKSL